MATTSKTPDGPSPASWAAFVLVVLVVLWMLTEGQNLELLLSGTIGVAFAACCIRLTLRMFNRDRRAKRTAARLLLGVGIGYPLSFSMLVTLCFWLPSWAEGIFYPAKDFFWGLYWPLICVCEEWPRLGEAFVLWVAPVGCVVAMLGFLAGCFFDFQRRK